MTVTHANAHAHIQGHGQGPTQAQEPKRPKGTDELPAPGAVIRYLNAVHSLLDWAPRAAQVPRRQAVVYLTRRSLDDNGVQGSAAALDRDSSSMGGVK